MKMSRGHESRDRLTGHDWMGCDGSRIWVISLSLLMTCLFAYMCLLCFRRRTPFIWFFRLRFCCCCLLHCFSVVFQLSSMSSSPPHKDLLLHAMRLRLVSPTAGDSKAHVHSLSLPSSLCNRIVLRRFLAVLSCGNTRNVSSPEFWSSHSKSQLVCH